MISLRGRGRGVLPLVGSTYGGVLTTFMFRAVSEQASSLMEDGERTFTIVFAISGFTPAFLPWLSSFRIKP